MARSIDLRLGSLRCPHGLYRAERLFGDPVAETILASVHVRSHHQAGHMGASDLINMLQNHLARTGPSTYGGKVTKGRIPVQAGLNP